MLKQDGRRRDFKPETGFDGGIILYNRKTKKCKFSGAKTGLYIFENGHLEFLNGDRCSIGFGRTRYDQEFLEYEFAVSEGIKLYCLTDGLLDQMNSKNEVYGKKRFEDLLLNIHDLSFDKQKELFFQDLLNFKGSREQIDDITVIGLEFI